MRDCSWWSSHLLETTPEKVEKEIAKGLDIKGAYESRQSYSSYIEVNIIVPPLICAAKSDNIKVVEVLLKHGADVNGNGVDGETALMGAVHRRNFAMAEMLIKSGANVNAQDNNGDSILEYASNGSCSADGEKWLNICFKTEQIGTSETIKAKHLLIILMMGHGDTPVME